MNVVCRVTLVFCGLQSVAPLQRDAQSSSDSSHSPEVKLPIQPRQKLLSSVGLAPWERSVGRGESVGSRELQLASGDPLAHEYRAAAHGSTVPPRADRTPNLHYNAPAMRPV